MGSPMSTDRSTPLLGRLAIHLEMIGMDQLAELTREQARAGGTNLGELMLQKGLITRLQLDKLLQAQKQVIAKQRAKQQADAALAAADPEPEVAAAPSATGTSAATRAGAADELTELLRLGVERQASDIHIHSGVPLRVRRHGRFEGLGDEPIPPQRAEALVRAALTPEQRTVFDERGELDFAYTVPGLGRFRVNAYREQRGTNAVFRHIPAEAPTLDELGLPGDLARYTNYHQGMVLITGPANCGKSSTLAALVRILNEERRDHILTIEDPIEYVHPSSRCVVNQRNVGPHTASFARALRAALREDPDVIVIGELRDFETISLALTAAETGHLVLGTMHTNSTIRTINRLIGVFPADQQEQVRNMVSESLRAVVSQRLVPTADGSGRVPALENLVVNKPVGNLIRENKTFQIVSQLQMGAKQGMCLLDVSLARLVQQGVVSRDEALRFAEDPKRIGG
jgi:twitching motility protein PilT